jgi:hemerythrin-like domain-containing protein
LLQQRQGEILAKATEVLRKEHDVILKVIEATEFTAARLERGEKVPDSLLAGLVEFFQLFADRCHHGKEEEVFFPRLVEKGMPRDAGPVGVMLREHEMGREMIRRMSQAEGAYRAGASSAASSWAKAARSYTDLLREHISKENEVLFTMAEGMLSEKEQQELAEAFERVEIERMGTGTHERLHARMEQLLREAASSPAH